MRPQQKPAFADLKAQVFNFAPSLERYEQDKQAWIASHPEATPEEYSAAMLAISKQCGV